MWQDCLINRWAPIVGLSLCFFSLQGKQKLLLWSWSSNNSSGFKAQSGQSYWKCLFHLPLRQQRWHTVRSKTKAKKLELMSYSCVLFIRITFDRLCFLGRGHLAKCYNIPILHSFRDWTLIMTGLNLERVIAILAAIGHCPNAGQ